MAKTIDMLTSVGFSWGVTVAIPSSAAIVCTVFNAFQQIYTHVRLVRRCCCLPKYCICLCCSATACRLSLDCRYCLFFSIQCVCPFPIVCARASKCTLLFFFSLWVASRFPSVLFVLGTDPTWTYYFLGR